MTAVSSRRSRLLVLASGLVLGLSGGGCGLPLADEALVIENLCDDDTQCPDGVCGSVEGVRRCVATTADLAGIVFQLEGTSVDGASISHVFEKGISVQGDREQGIVVELSLDVPPPVGFSGTFLSPDGPVPGCTAADGSVPVKLELRRTAALSGLEQVFTKESEPLFDDLGAVSTHRFALEVPAGRYDVYLAPKAAPLECGGGLPPRVFPSVDVASDVVFAPEAEAPRRLTGHITPTADRSLEGFRVELLDPARGLLVSEAVSLGAPTEPGGALPLLGGPEGNDERGMAYYYTDGLLLRLSEPDGELVVHWVFDALDREGDGVVEIDLADLIANPKPLRATVIDPQGQPVPAARITIKSLELTGNVAQNAQYRVTSESDAAGGFDVNLVPGLYQVLVTPGQEGAVLEDEWIVTEDSLCCGKTFPLGARPLVTGTISTATGDGVPGVPVLASPTLRGERSYFSSVFEELDMLPRQAETTADGAALLSLTVDPGEYDLSVRAPAATGFPWLVLPALVVAPVEQQSALSLGALVLPSPAVLIGRTSLEGVLAPGAVLRAFLPLADDPGGAGATPKRVVSIGEAVVGADGRFVLPLPPTVTRGSGANARQTSDQDGARP